MEQPRRAFKESIFGYSWKDMNKLTSESGTTHLLEAKLQLAVKYIEQQCNAKFGFLTDVSKEADLSNSITAIPNIYDAALLVDVLKNTGVMISTVVTDSVCKLLERHRSSDGSWNYFHSDYKILPNDVDTSSEAALALWACGTENRVIEKMAAIVREKAVIHEDGLVDVYMEKAASDDSSAAIYQKWPVVRRVDVSIVANFLYLQNKVGQDHLPKLDAAYQLVNNVIDALHRKDYSNSVIMTYVKTYEKLDVVCFYVSRLVGVSDFGKTFVKENLTSIIMDNSHNRSNDTISIACRILAGVNCGLMEMKDGRDMIARNIQNLLVLQDEDYSFRKSFLYNAHGQFYFGSKALSTAFAVAAITAAKLQLPSFWTCYHCLLT